MQKFCCPEALLVPSVAYWTEQSVVGGVGWGRTLRDRVKKSNDPSPVCIQQVVLYVKLNCELLNYCDKSMKAEWFYYWSEVCVKLAPWGP